LIAVYPFGRVTILKTQEKLEPIARRARIVWVLLDHQVIQSASSEKIAILESLGHCVEILSLLDQWMQLQRASTYHSMLFCNAQQEGPVAETEIVSDASSLGIGGYLIPRGRKMLAGFQACKKMAPPRLGRSGRTYAVLNRATS
jgi:hypothetical protein